MRSRVLSRAEAGTTKVVAAVAIIGAGPAGLLAALRLTRRTQKPVVLIESGSAGTDPAFDFLNEMEGRDRLYPPGFAPRARGLGGTSQLWSGKLLPLTRHDLQARPYAGLPGWPLEANDLERYLREIEAIWGVDTESYEEEVTDLFDRATLLPRPDQDLLLRWPKRPLVRRHNLAAVLRNELAALDNLEIWTEATVSGFEFDLAAGRLTSVTATGPVGRVLQVQATEFLLAAGTFESTRLLLLAQRQSQNRIFQECRALGHYFHEHLGVHVDRLRPIDAERANRAFSDRYPFSSQRHLHFELTPQAQERRKIASGYADLAVEVPDTSALTGARQIAHALRRRGAGLHGKDFRAVLHDLPALFHTAQWRLARRQKYWPPNARVELKLWIEQVPRWESRLTLSEKTDALGTPMLKIDWRADEVDERCFQELRETVETYWRRHFASLAHLEPLIDPEARLLDHAFGQAHPAGSTRMGLDPSESVVGTTLATHALANLSVASASVFPSSGSANPSLTIMQLALRAADAIAGRLDG